MKNLRFLGFLFILPLVVGAQVGENDSSVTNIKVGGGAGSYAYVTRGCEGQVINKKTIPFRDIGFSFDHKFRFPVRVGLRGGQIWDKNVYPPDETITNLYLNPHVSLEFKSFGIGAGVCSAQKELSANKSGSETTLPSWHLRLGSRKLYFSIHMLENVPIYSGGGFVNLGFGGRAGRNASCWFGVSSPRPYDALGFLAKTNFKLQGNWHLDLAGRLGTSEGISESAVSLGLNYRFVGK